MAASKEFWSVVDLAAQSGGLTAEMLAALMAGSTVAKMDKNLGSVMALLMAGDLVELMAEQRAGWKVSQWVDVMAGLMAARLVGSKAVLTVWHLVAAMDSHWADRWALLKVVHLEMLRAGESASAKAVLTDSLLVVWMAGP